MVAREAPEPEDERRLPETELAVEARRHWKEPGGDEQVPRADAAILVQQRCSRFVADLYGPRNRPEPPKGLRPEVLVVPRLEFRPEAVEIDVLPFDRN